jgi:predicted alpha-1,6-mannanase (GH76 family)
MKIFCVLMFLLSATLSIFAFEPREADAIFNAYNTNFYVLHHGSGFYKKDLTGGHSDFWTQAEQIEMIIDAHERTGDANTRQMITDSIHGFIRHSGTDWMDNKFNDDICWMTIACARGFLVTSNRAFLDLATKHFAAVYTRAYDTTLGGGMWWKIGEPTKNACVNGPAAIAACLLYKISGDKSYLEKAKTIYAWERKTLFNPTNGAVADHINTNGVIAKYVFTYNEGTFIGAANYLFQLTGETNYFNDALLAANFTRHHLSHGGNLPAYGGGDVAGFNGIFARWLACFANDNHLWPQYYDWMSENAEAALKVRRTDGLAWQNWNDATPAGNLDSWGCSAAVEILQVVPASRPE